MDYRFAIRCWQDQAGDENARINVYVDGTLVADQVEITATSADSPQLVTWESLELTAPAADTSFDIKVVLDNELYIDEDTDRNVNINGIGYVTKDANTYKMAQYTYDPSDATNTVFTGNTEVTDFTDFNNYINYLVPTAVTGDQLADDWWSSRDTNTFYTIPVYGDPGGAGVTMTCSIANASIGVV